MNKRLTAAMSAYAAIAVLAAFTLDGGLLRNGVWVLMAFFALKSYIAHRAGWTQSADREHDGHEGHETAGEDANR
jgi:hypothetical protein